jgi:ABC-type phosphate/phosphonate transport system substrate-binding protein
VITSFRMYNAAPGAAQAWRALFGRVFAETGVDVRFVEHGAPRPIAELWGSADLCCDFMCGWPFVRSKDSMQPIAVPVPSPARYEGRSRYCSEFLVREASGWTRLEDTFGARIGWMAANSQSGFNAPRAHLARFATRERPVLYRESRGPLGAPAQALDALRSGAIDVVALDGFWLDLVRRHDPARLEGIRTIATTAWTPMPLLVAARAVPPNVVEKLRGHLLSVHGTASYAPLLADVLVERFVVPDLASYSMLEALQREAMGRDYDAIR